MSDAAMPDVDRDEIVRATLPHVAFEGWSRMAVAAGLTDLGLPEEAARLAFPGGMTGLIRHWSAMLDRQMTDSIVAAADEMAPLSPTERVAGAIRVRLDACRWHREAVRRAISYLALPPSPPAALQMTYDTVNAIWYAAGDRSTDFSYYTRRASLVAVYAATVLFWLDDDSDEQEATWAFLDRRLHEIGSLIRLRRRFTDAWSGFRRPFTSRSAREPAEPVPPSPDLT